MIACVIVFILIFMYVLVNFDQINRLKSTSVTFQVNGALGLIAQAIFDSRSDKTILSCKLVTLSLSQVWPRLWKLSAEFPVDITLYF